MRAAKIVFFVLSMWLGFPNQHGQPHLDQIAQPRNRNQNVVEELVARQLAQNHRCNVHWWRRKGCTST